MVVALMRQMSSVFAFSTVHCARCSSISLAELLAELLLVDDDPRIWPGLMPKNRATSVTIRPAPPPRAIRPPPPPPKPPPPPPPDTLLLSSDPLPWNVMQVRLPAVGRRYG